MTTSQVDGVHYDADTIIDRIGEVPGKKPRTDSVKSHPAAEEENGDDNEQFVTTAPLEPRVASVEETAIE